MKFVVLIIAFLSMITSKVSSQPKYEFRGAWVATVSNIDWPSRSSLSTDSQKAEFIRILDLHHRNGLNAVIVQVRPSTDAFFPSPFEPWSEFLTGKQGQPPMPYYDPMAFMIEETHKRGMEFHAWCNPYRAEFSLNRSSIAPTHVTRLHPEWFLVYGGKRYFDPGNKEVQRYVTAVIRDMVRRYDIDAVHFDDYFYPYRIAGVEFPDASSYGTNNKGLEKEEWRRSNVDSVILSLSRAIKEENKYCKFGVSPFGVWRNSDKDPAGSNTRGGQTNYDDLYADILLWLRLGWVDYVTPQLYWEFGHRLVAYETLIDWWGNNAHGRHLYIGHGIYKAYQQNVPAWRNPHELPDQINKLREYSTVQGSAYYSTKSFFRNPNGWNDSLRNNYYRTPAIVPPMNWIDSVRPAKPILRLAGGLGWQVSAPAEKRIRFFVLYSLDTSRYTFLYPQNQQASIDKQLQDIYCRSGCSVTVVNRGNLESDPTTITR